MTSQHCRRELRSFQTVCSYLYSENLQLGNELFEKIIRNFTHIDDELNKNIFNFFSTRCLAIFTMHDALYTDNITERWKLLKSAQKLFNESIEIPDKIIIDSEMTGFAYLTLCFFIYWERKRNANIMSWKQ